MAEYTVISTTSTSSKAVQFDESLRVAGRYLSVLDKMSIEANGTTYEISFQGDGNVPTGSVALHPEVAKALKVRVGDTVKIHVVRGGYTCQPDDVDIVWDSNFTE